MNVAFQRGLSLLLALLFCIDVSAAAEQDRNLGAGDLIKVSVFGYPDLTSELRISQSGNITFPLVGEVAVAGSSPRAVEGSIKSRLINGGFIRDPQVSVLVIEYESQKAAVMGQVNRPGKYALAASSRVLDYLAEAGGVVNEVAADRATLLRKDGSRLEIDLHALFEGDPEQNVVVAGGDTLYVPKAPKFYIYGEVRNPGAYRLERGMTLSRAISIGGGLTPRGSEDRVAVTRSNGDQTEQEISLESGDRLQADDVIMVKERWF